MDDWGYMDWKAPCVAKARKNGRFIEIFMWFNRGNNGTIIMNDIKPHKHPGGRETARAF